MAIAESLKSVQFVVDDQGERTAVLLDIAAWETLISWIETLTDTKIAMQALTELEQAGGRPEQAGWLAWDDLSEEWGDEEKIEANPL